MEEIWKAVSGHSDYEVSDRGRVRRVTGRTAGRVMRQKLDNGKYLLVGLSSEGAQKFYLVHRLVLLAFGPPQPTEHHETHHRNSIRDDNHIENLEWVTKSENLTHAYRTGSKKPARPCGELNGRAKLTDNQVLEIRQRLANGETQTSVALAFGVVQSTVSMIKVGKRWSET